MLAAARSRRICFFEEGQRFGGIGETFADKLLKYGFSGKYKLIGVEGEFSVQDSVPALYHNYRLDKEGIIATVLEETAGRGSNDGEDKT